MTKAELIEEVAKVATTKKQAKEAVEVVFDSIKKSLKKKNGIFSIVGFGSFTVQKRKRRNGRNPRTGEPMVIKASKVPKFRPGKAFREALN